METGDSDFHRDFDSTPREVFIKRTGGHFARAHPGIDSLAGRVEGARHRGSRAKLALGKGLLQRDFDDVLELKTLPVLDHGVHEPGEAGSRPRHIPAQAEESDPPITNRQQMGNDHIHAAAIIRGDHVDVGARIIVNDRDDRKFFPEAARGFEGPPMDEHDAIYVPCGESPRLEFGFENVRAFLGSVVMRDQGHVQCDRGTAHSGEVLVVRIKTHALRKREDVTEAALT